MLLAGLFIALAFQAIAAQTAEERAVDYLAREVPRWFRENQCFSCHNNGDGARALYAASRRGYQVPQDALAGTTRWLMAPGKWDDNRSNPAFSDKKLARIQFAASLAQAYESGFIHDTEALIQAAESLLPYQATDGSWQVDGGENAGSPATYGTALATYMARRILKTAGSGRFADEISRANEWFLAAKPRSILDAAAMLLAMPDAAYADTVLAAQTSDGGWGPQVHAPAEAFDTAVVLLALQGMNEPDRTRDAIARGRAFLMAAQEPSGGWPETTRPPGAQSYAQHISTSGWAALALVATGAER
ncbi:MAG: hypothetical protein ACRD7E_24525 [Bryobacteraceae bacterium]